MLRTSNRIKNTSWICWNRSETHLPCKRRDMTDFVQNGSIWIEHLEIQGFNFLDSGNRMFSRRRPLPAFSPVGFNQYLATLAAEYFKNGGFKCFQVLFTPKSRFDPKAKSSKMGLSIDPRQFSVTPNPFSQYLAPLGAKYMGKRQEK